jgi:hypothetical protein
MKALIVPYPGPLNALLAYIEKPPESLRIWATRFRM